MPTSSVCPAQYKQLINFLAEFSSAQGLDIILYKQLINFRTFIKSAALEGHQPSTVDVQMLKSLGIVDIALPAWHDMCVTRVGKDDFHRVRLNHLLSANSIHARRFQDNRFWLRS